MNIIQTSSNNTGFFTFKHIFISLFQLYEISDDPKRKEFLDDLFQFMQKRGKSINDNKYLTYLYRNYVITVYLQLSKIFRISAPTPSPLLHPPILQPSLTFCVEKPVIIQYQYIARITNFVH